MTSLRGILLGITLLVPPAVWAQDEKPVARLLEDLDADDVAVREQAAATLIKKGKDVEADLELAFAAAKSLEVRKKIREILNLLKIAPGGGAIVNGLKLVLKADRGTIKPGESVTFEVTVWNATAEPMNLYVGYSTGGVVFESGSAFRITAPRDDQTSTPKWLVGFCGTGARPLYATIAPYKSQSFQTTATFKGESPGAPPVPAHYLFGEHKWLKIDAPNGRVHCFTAQLTVEPRWVTTHLGHVSPVGNTPLDPKGVSWTGAATSNEVRLELSEK